MWATLQAFLFRHADVAAMRSALELTACPDDVRDAPLLGPPGEADPMKLTPRYLAAYVAAIAPIAVVGFAGMFVGHLAVLVVTLGIFFGTLSLGRQVTTSSPTADKTLVAAPVATETAA